MNITMRPSAIVIAIVVCLLVAAGTVALVLLNPEEANAQPYGTGAVDTFAALLGRRWG